MRTSPKLLNRLTDEDLTKVYHQYVQEGYETQLATWPEIVESMGRGKALEYLANEVNVQLPHMNEWAQLWIWVACGAIWFHHIWVALA